MTAFLLGAYVSFGLNPAPHSGQTISSKLILGSPDGWMTLPHFGQVAEFVICASCHTPAIPL